MARRGRQCVVEGCWRRAKSGKLVCIDHQRTGLGKELGREIAKLERGVRAMLMGTGQDASDRAAKRFQRQVERGEFAAVFAGRMQELFDQDMRQAGALDDEIGAMRIAMMRLLLEESDPARLAKGISQITNATVRALRAQKEIETPRVTAAMLERSINTLERSGRALSEDEVLEREQREWERAVGWNKTMEKAWYSPENQRRLLEEGKREAIERMNRRWEMRGRRQAGEAASRQGSEVAMGNGQWAIGEEMDARCVESPLFPTTELPPSPDPFPLGQGERGEVEMAEIALTPGPSPDRERGGSVVEEEVGEGEWPTGWAELEDVPKYANELERLFWEDPDPFAHERELRRQMEEEGY